MVVQATVSLLGLYRHIEPMDETIEPQVNNRLLVQNSISLECLNDLNLILEAYIFDWVHFDMLCYVDLLL